MLVCCASLCVCGCGAGKEGASKEGEGKEEEPRAAHEDDRSAQELEGVISTLCHLLAACQRQAQISKSGLEAKLAVHTALEVILRVSQGEMCSLTAHVFVSRWCITRKHQGDCHVIACSLAESTILTNLTRLLCFVVWVWGRGG